MDNHKKPNRLVHSLSPYLLQHAYNPVDWFPWGEEAFEKAKKENKPVLVSIGYSACHWCHVMEHQCFEDESIAKLMNEHFINIKVDREERPDIDQIYMEAIQAMGLNGGWPLNVFLTPYAKPFYGGTYFPSSNWKSLLTKINDAYKHHQKQLEESAEKFSEVLNISDIKKFNLSDQHIELSKKELDHIYTRLSQQFDLEKGGIGNAPKFPMPCVYFFLLRYYHYQKKQDAIDHITHTLKEMAAGGIYDQIRGGFARYSVDEEWFAPHFEKMLYDNAQLISLYSEAYLVTKEEKFKKIVYQTIEFLQQEMKDPKGGFYSALDADSDGKEGKFYIWKKEEIDTILKEDASLFNSYYHIIEEGNWEDGYNILYSNDENSKLLATKYKISENELKNKIESHHSILLKERNKRNRPGTDDKIITSWNALTITALIDAYEVFQEKKFLDLALETTNFILLILKKENGNLHRIYKNEQTSIEAYLEDYACFIQALTKMYQATFDEKWIRHAFELTQYTIDHFYDSEEKLFYFTSDISEKLIARKKELFDTVIPSSNSIMATNLHFLSFYTYNEKWQTISKNMLQGMHNLLKGNTTHLANWATLYIYRLFPTIEIAIVGEKTLEYKNQINQSFYPNKILAGSLDLNFSIPFLKEKTNSSTQATVYICHQQTCSPPLTNIKEVIEKIHNFNL